MPDVTEAHTTPGTPRWHTLLLMGLGVLAIHLWLLTDGLLPDLATPVSTLKTEAPAAQPAPNEASPSSVLPVPSAPLHVSKVRWIVPTPDAAPATEPASQVIPPSTAQAPTRAVARKPLAPVVETPAPAPAAEALPPPDEPVSVAVAEEASTVVAQAAPTQAVHESPAPPIGKALPPSQPPASTRLQYEVAGRIKGFSYNATGTLDWELDGGRYNARMEMRMPLLGARVQTSTGGVGPEGLMPERFADKSRSERAAHFERAQHRIRFSANTPEAELLPGAQDRLSLFLQIAGLLQARPQAYASGQVIDMQVAGTGDAEIWRFQVGEESTLTLPAGELRVRHLVRQPRKEFDSTVEMWLAPELHYLPVRLKVTQANGDMADQQLSQKP
jgi:hypothetical protein